MAASEDWKVREVAATALVEISKKHPGAVVAELSKWARRADENVRRASSEGLRGLAHVDFDAVLPVLGVLNADSSAYVRKSVANLLSDGSKKRPDLVLEACARWARSGDKNTLWIVSHGLIKLRETHPREVDKILGPALAEKAAKPAPAQTAAKPAPAKKATATKATATKAAKATATKAAATKASRGVQSLPATVYSPMVPAGPRRGGLVRPGAASGRAPTSARPPAHCRFCPGRARSSRNASFRRTRRRAGRAWLPAPVRLAPPPSCAVANRSRRREGGQIEVSAITIEVKAHGGRACGVVVMKRPPSSARSGGATARRGFSEMVSTPPFSPVAGPAVAKAGRGAHIS
ncbi:MAG TPA: hypothetical protein VFS43_19920 [Polyangiaceae bacterium]|nr:hypothetical protein [Polyangiaceae bacterium]